MNALKLFLVGLLGFLIGAAVFHMSVAKAAQRGFITIMPVQNPDELHAIPENRALKSTADRLFVGHRDGGDGVRRHAGDGCCNFTRTIGAVGIPSCSLLPMPALSRWERRNGALADGALRRSLPGICVRIGMG